MSRTPMARYPATLTTGEASATTTMDAEATTDTSVCSHPVTAGMKRNNEEIIIQCKET